VGFLAAPIELVGPAGVTAGMVAVHVVAELVFFFALLGRSLLADFKAVPPVALALGGLVYGLYHLSYFAVLQLGVAGMVVTVLQIGAFGGAAYLALMWASGGGLLGPLLAHLAMWYTLLVRSIA
jgi:hypothetical protein